MAAAAAVLAAAAAVLAASPQEAARAPGDLRLDAERVACDATTGRCRLEGRVVLRRGEVVLRADRAVVAPATGEVDAEGNVLLVDAERVVSARAVHAVIGGAYRAEDVIAWLKEGPVRLEDAEALGGARVGRNRLRLSGRSLSGEEEGPFRLDGARVTLCDCGGDAAPSWELRARSATVVPGHHADLSWPVLWITPRFLFVDRPVPVLAFPWLRLPISDRQTGLLLPLLGGAGASGTALALPLFVTLGRSADLTLTAAYAFGGNAPKVRGPGAALELRWAPAVDAAGQVEVGWWNDLLDESDAGTYGVSGTRLSILGRHAQRISARTSLRVDVTLFADPLHVRDFDVDRLGRDAFYRRSDLLLSYRRDDAVLEASAAYHIALASTSSRDAAEALDREYGALGGGLPLFHRWPSVSADLLPLRILGPLHLSGRAGLARFAPLSGVTSDGGFDLRGPGDRGWVPVPPPPYGDAGQLDGRWEDGERLAVTRADARAELSLPLLVARAVSLEPYVRGAVLGYAFDAALDPRASAWAVGGASVSTELSRRFGALRHAIVPRVEWRMGSAESAFGSGSAIPVASYDLWDRLRVEPSRPLVPGDPSAGSYPPGRVLVAAPRDWFHQLRVGVETRLSSPSADLLRVAVGQDVDLREGKLAETWFSAGAAIRPLSLDVHGRLDALEKRAEPPGFQVPAGLGSWLDAFTVLRASAAVADRRGDALSVGLLALGPGASGDLVAGVDALFDPEPAPVGALAQGFLGARAVLGPATLGYDAQFPGRPLEVQACDGTGTRTLASAHVQQHVASFTWNSPCRCFRAQLVVRVDDCGRVGWSGGIDLSRAPAAPAR